MRHMSARPARQTAGMSEPQKYSHITLTWKLLIAEAIATLICLGLIFLLIEPGGARDDNKTNAIILIVAMVLLIGGGVLTGIGRSTFEIQQDGLLVTDSWVTPISFFAPRGRTFIRGNEIASLWNSITTVRNKSRVYKYANGHIRTVAGREFKFSARIDTPAYLEKFVPFYEALRANLPDLNLNPLPIERA